MHSSTTEVIDDRITTAPEANPRVRDHNKLTAIREYFDLTREAMIIEADIDNGHGGDAELDELLTRRGEIFGAHALTRQDLDDYCRGHKRRHITWARPDKTVAQQANEALNHIFYAG